MATAKPCHIFSPEDGEIHPVTVACDDDSKLCKKLVEEFSSQENNKMEVFLRIRPLTRDESKLDINECCVEIQPNKEEVLLKAPIKSATFRNNPNDFSRLNTAFTFSKVFGPDCTQRHFYSGAVSKTVQDFLHGQNCLVFAYGATNSGKTFTVQGNKDSPGVIPMSLEVIFSSLGKHLSNVQMFSPISSIEVERLSSSDQTAQIELKEKLLMGMSNAAFFQSKDNLTVVSQESMNIFDTTDASCASVNISDGLLRNSTYLVYVSFAEIYNEQVFDLICQSNDVKKRPKLNLVQDSSGNSYVKGLRKVFCKTVDEALKLLALGRKNLHMAATKLNQNSSRSHCIFTVYTIRVQNEGQELAYVNNLSFCDLAGSERVMKTSNTGERLKEAANINTSLMVLGRCIDTLKTNQALSKERSNNIVPYRDSKLTRLFQSFFNGQGKASMIVNIAPSCVMFDDTLNVLKFSALAKQVVTKDKIDRSLMNMTSSISERLTNFWVKSNRRWSSIAMLKSNKQSILTIPDMVETDLETLEEEEDWSEFTEEDYEELLNDLKEHETKATEYEQTIKKLEKEKMEIEKKTKDHAYEFFTAHIKEIEKDHKERLERQQEQADDMLNKRTEMLENYIEKLNSRRTASESSDEEDIYLNDRSMQTVSFTSSMQTVSVASSPISLQSAKSSAKDLTALLEENQRLKERLSHIEIENDKLKSSLQSEVTTLLEQKQSLISTLELENDKLKNSLQSVETETKDSLVSVNSHAHQLKQRIADLNNELCQRRLDHDTVQEENDQLKSNATLLEQKQSLISTLELENEKLKGRLQSVETETKDNLVSVNSHAHQLKQRIADLNNELCQRRLDHDKVREENDQLKSKAQNVKFSVSKVSSLQEQVQCLTRDLEQAREELTDTRTDFDKLGNILLEKDSQIADLTQKLQLLQDSLKTKIQSESLLQSKDRQIHVLTEKVKSFQDLLKKETQSESLLKSKDGRISDLTVKVEALQDSLKKETQLLQDLLKKETQSESLLKSKDSQISDLTVKVEALQDSLKKETQLLRDSLKKETQFLHDSLKKETQLLQDSLKKETQLESVLQSKDLHISDLAQKLKGTEDHVSDLMEKIKSSEANVEKLTAELDEMENFRKPQQPKRSTRSRRQLKNCMDSDDESSNMLPVSTENLPKLEATRSPLAVIGDMLQQSTIYKGVMGSAEKVGSYLFSKSPTEANDVGSAVEAGAGRRMRRRLYRNDSNLLECSAANLEASPPKMARKPLVRESSRKRAKK